MFVDPYPQPYPKSPFDLTERFIEVAPPQQPSQRRYVNYMADRQGCGQWRIGWAENHINMSSIGDSCSLTKMIINEQWYEGVTAVKLQRQASPDQLRFVEFLNSIKSKYGFKLIYEVDDVVFREDIPDYNIYKPAFDTDQVRQTCIDIINLCDEMTVTCKYIKDLYSLKTGKKEITVVPNFPPRWWIGHQYNHREICQNFDRHRRKPRIAYAGSGAHFDVANKTGQQDDFTHVIEFILKNVDRYQFVFIGAVPLPLEHLVRENKIELHQWQNLVDYPTYLSKLNIQLFLAPLQNNSFNKSKSDIKYIEAACLGIPCLCQDMVTYGNALSDLKFTNSDDLAYKVEKLLNWKNRSEYYSLVPELRNIGSQRFLELDDNIGAFMEALNTDYGDPARKLLPRWN
jgi:glycosyltransferase involved in cell wall biosynthesis